MIEKEQGSQEKLHIWAQTLLNIDSILVYGLESLFKVFRNIVIIFWGGAGLFVFLTFFCRTTHSIASHVVGYKRYKEKTTISTCIIVKSFEKESTLDFCG